MPVKFRRSLLFASGALLAVAAVAIPVVVGTAVAGPASANQPRIVGGEKASLSEHPYAVYLTDAGGNQFCGAVIVSSTSVATAAHCAKAVAKQDIRVVAGREDKRTGDGQVLGVSKVWVAQGYSDPTKGGDVAVLTVRGQLDYRPAKLPESGDAGLYAKGTQATVLGWGRIADGGARSDYLRSADVPVVSDSECRTDYDVYDQRTMVCAGYAEGGVDACQGDSGGPLVVGDTLIGIVSFGDGCAKANRPGVYTRVSTYANDIEAQARPRLLG
ncbi:MULTISPECIES: serine protease [unclassified Amycolatopsis]|uniref:S1 family peptidase n=1 Tax=unclassified Amycolatopsis TaxID=2618356 RepID=UPI0028763D48|nr:MULTISPECIES: serine protease [unclassified Amycolatopsis]MDS0137875.1 serine protease [Amycolatopsis sp. 505]MDS0144212.1 serine protease [Amycolatopsis sp. CM201R]